RRDFLRSCNGVQLLHEFCARLQLMDRQLVAANLEFCILRQAQQFQFAALQADDNLMVGNVDYLCIVDVSRFNFMLRDSGVSGCCRMAYVLGSDTKTYSADK